MEPHEMNAGAPQNPTLLGVFDRSYITLCAIVLPLFSACILVLQPTWSIIFLAITVAAAALGLVCLRIPYRLYKRSLILLTGITLFVIGKLIHDWWFGLPLRPEGYLSLIVRLLSAILFSAAISNKLRPTLKALCVFSVVVVVHAIVGQILAVFVTPAPAPFLDASEANSFSYYQVFNLFYYSQAIRLTDTLWIWRAHGVMWEPGIFQFFPNYLLVCGLGNFCPTRKKMLVVLGLLGVLISTSTMGIAIAGCIILMNSRLSLLSVLSVFMIIIAPSAFLFAAKFDLGTTQSLSTIIRLVDLEVPLTYFIQFPLFGVGNDPSVVQMLGVHSYFLDYLIGAGQSAFLSSYMDNIFETNRVFNTSNGLLAILMQYGAVFGCGYIYGIYRFSKLSELGTAFSALLLLTIFNEPVALTALFLWISIHGLMMPPAYATASKRALMPIKNENRHLLRDPL